METLHDHLYRGPIVGIGFSGQAGSAFPVLGVLHILQEAAKREGRSLKALYAFDPNANPKLAPIIKRIAQNYGIETTYVREVPIPKYREGVDSGHLFFYDLKPNLDPYVESELQLLKEAHPSLVISLLRPTLYFSREIYYRRTGRYVPYVAFGYGILLGQAGRYSVPMNYFPFAVPLWAERLLKKSRVIAKLSHWLLRYKVAEGRRYMRRYLSPSYHPQPFPPFEPTLLGDITLIPSSPHFLLGDLPAHAYPIGSVPIDFPLTQGQRSRQKFILEQIASWKSTGKTIIFVAMGTTGQALPKVLLTLEPLLCQPESPYRLIVATTTLEKLSPPSSPISKLLHCGTTLVNDWFDLDSVMPSVSLLIHHAGLNTIEIALQHNTPMLAVAPQQIEQGLNALMMQRGGFGEIVWGKRLSDLPTVLPYVLNNIEHYKQRIADYKHRFAPYYDRAEKETMLVHAINEAFHLARQD